jgi:LacI family transcriptional regulator
MSKARLHDVARRAGVSIKTVSRVINNEPNVRDSTRDAVMAAIAALDYHPDTSARRLASRRSYLIGLLYEDPSPYESPSATYVTALQGGVLERTRAEGYDLLIHPCADLSAELTPAIRSLVVQTHVDGVILAPPLAEKRSLVRVLRELQTPFVRISPGTPSPDDEAIQTDDRAACRKMTCYLASLGHQRIGFIVGHQDHRAVQNRYLGYQDGLTGANLPLEPTLVQHGDNSFESGVRCARMLLTQRHPPSAIFASNDDMAAGVMRVAHEMGMSIPDDVSVAGYDDSPLARQLWPSLTTIRQPTFEMASAAAQLLLARIHQRDERPASTLLPGQLVLRETTAPPPNAPRPRPWERQTLTID